MSTSVDLTSCDREPIHIPGSIQPHGILLTLQEPELAIVQASENAAKALGVQGTSILGMTLADLFLPEDLALLQTQVLPASREASPRYLMRLRQSGAPVAWVVAAHRSDGILVMELEERREEDSHVAAELHAALRRTAAELDSIESLIGFCQCAAERLRDFTGFDRVMVYQFHPDGHGSVIAESRKKELEPYLGLHYPASDIPAQARQLYLRNPFRLTADVNAAPVPLLPPLNPITGRPVDMSFCALRATSPVHLEYLRNMGVAASLSFSILREEQLWGLFACHHGQPKVVSQEARTAGEILARLLGLQVGLKEQAEQRSYALGLHAVRCDLVERLADSGDFALAFIHGNCNLLTNFRATGAALRTSSKTFLLGDTPDLQAIDELSSWLDQQHRETVWATHSLPTHYKSAESSLKPPESSLRKARGLLAMHVAPGSPEAVLWFRPEVIETVNWAGDPDKAVRQNEDGHARLHPRKSFAVWQEQVTGKSEPWQELELDHARILRDSMSDALLRHRASEVNRLNTELMRSNRQLKHLAALASHDLQEPLRTITAYTQLLSRSLLSNGSDEDRERIQFILDAALRMRALTDSLLDYARLGERHKVAPGVSIAAVVQTALKNLGSGIEETGATVRLGPLPTISADSDQMVRVFQNLIGNALKYCKPGCRPVINVTSQETEIESGAWLFSVKDDGIGFDPQYADRIFESFERLQGPAQSGSGLGLAICRKIIENHGGTIWAESRPGEGATFYFNLPNRA